MFNIHKLTAVQILVLGYMIVTLVGALLLSLPISSAKGTYQPFIDSLFVSTSGISTSGLCVVDVGSYYSLFGQIVLMCIFQIGGIGYMAFFIFIAYLLGTRMSFKTGVIARESMVTYGNDMRMLAKFFINVLVYTFIFELIGAIILAYYFKDGVSAFRAIYLGVFHSISAFCTAGFSVFPDSLMKYRSNMPVNLTINIISIIGGLGFFVLMDSFGYILKRLKNIPAKLTVHTKMVLIVTLIVMFAGAVIIFAAEKWPAHTGLTDKILFSSFQSISASTTDGFNTINIGAMSQASLTILMVLMFIGASPGSTGGGIKTTTFWILLLSAIASLRGKTKINIFEREIPPEIVRKAFAIFCFFLAVALIDITIMSNTEKGSYLQTLFEIISALGNTGLSTGITSGLSFIGKTLLIITMFIGRVGPLTIGAALISKEKQILNYPKEDVFVG